MVMDMLVDKGKDFATEHPLVQQREPIPLLIWEFIDQRKLTTHKVRTAGVQSVVRHQLLPVFTLRREQVTQALVTHCRVRRYNITLSVFSNVLFWFIILEKTCNGPQIRTVRLVDSDAVKLKLRPHRRLCAGSSWCRRPGWWSPPLPDGTQAPARWSSCTRWERWCRCRSGTCSRRPSRLSTPRRVHGGGRSCQCRLQTHTHTHL